MNAEQLGEHAPLAVREIIARALWEFAYADDPIPEPWPTDGEEKDVAMLSADAVLAALGAAGLSLIDLGEPIPGEMLRAHFGGSWQTHEDPYRAAQSGRSTSG